MPDYPPLPPDDLHTALIHTFPLPDGDDLPHIALVGDTYTITVAGRHRRTPPSA